MIIKPFRGWRFAGDNGDVSSLIAPPYDILNQADKDQLLSDNDKNIVAIDLPHVPPKDAGTDEEYTHAAQTLAQWQSDGTLKQDDQAAIYVYRQEYSWAGVNYSRLGMLCGVRATALGEDVIPHEHTFAGPKADRLRLTEETKTQMSPIFGFYNDPDGKVGQILDKTTSSTSDNHGTLSGTGEKIWKITDPADITIISGALASECVYIADGHHRYTTALNYRDSLGQIDENHEANFVMFCLVAGDNPGLLVLPTHRIFTGLVDDFNLDDFMSATSDTLSWQSVDPKSADLSDADTFLAPFGPGAIAFVSPGAKQLAVAKLTNTKTMSKIAPDVSDAWRSLDVAVLHALIIDRLIEQFKTDSFEITYTPDLGEAINACKSGASQLAAILQGTPLDAVRAVADAHDSMPHKSTYFYPKLATGMVLKPLK